MQIDTKDKDVQLQMLFMRVGKGCLRFYWDETITERKVGKALHPVKIMFCLKKSGLPFDFACGYAFFISSKVGDNSPAGEEHH